MTPAEPSDRVRIDTGDEFAAMARQVGCQAVALLRSYTGELFDMASNELLPVAHQCAGVGA